MELKTIPAMQMLYYKLRTTLRNMKQEIGNPPMIISREALQMNLQIAGPQTWVYFGADGQLDTAFDLEICLPVVGVSTSQSSTFKIKQVPDFKCAAVIHRGNWDTLGATYEKVIGELLAAGYKMTEECREVYTVIDMDNIENNITEVLIGVK